MKVRELKVVVRNAPSQVELAFEIREGLVERFSAKATGWDRRYPEWTGLRYHPARVEGMDVHAFIDWLSDLDELDGYHYYVVRETWTLTSYLDMLFAIYSAFKPLRPYGQ